MLNLFSPEDQSEVAKIVGKAWADPAFKAKFIQDPKAALSELGYDLPAAMPEITVVENTSSRIYFVLPEQPAGYEISEEDLERVAAAGCATECSTCGACPTQSWGCH